MPDLSGPEVCRQLRADGRIGMATPILLSTAGPAGRQQRIEAYQAGAWEFYGQPLDPEILLLKIRIYLDVRATAERLTEETLLDELTGLYSAKGLLRRTDELLADARRTHREVTVVTISWTTPTGPSCSRKLERWRAGPEWWCDTVRAADVVGRVGPLASRWCRPVVPGRVLSDSPIAWSARCTASATAAGRSRCGTAIQETTSEEVSNTDAKTLLGSVVAS